MQVGHRRSLGDIDDNPKINWLTVVEPADDRPNGWVLPEVISSAVHRSVEAR